MKTPVLTLYAKDDCKACDGEGRVYDSVPVPFGVGNCSMPSDCECAFENLSEELIAIIDKGEVEIVVEHSNAWLTKMKGEFNDE